MSHHLAQVNIARMRANLSDPSMADLSQRIAEINSLAERSRGFVWRYKPAEAASDELHVFSDYFVPFDPARFFFNMSLWQTIEDLKHHVFQTAHVELFKDKARWMAHFEKAHSALWWVPSRRFPVCTPTTSSGCCASPITGWPPPNSLSRPLGGGHHAAEILASARRQI